MGAFRLALAVLPLGYFGIVSIYHALNGFVPLPENRWVSGLRYPLLFAAMFVLVNIIDFYGGVTSPLPWKAFIAATESHGFFDGVLSFLSVTLVDLWLLWIPANIWINNTSYLDEKRRYAARSMNLIAGLLLISARNLVY